MADIQKVMLAKKGDKQAFSDLMQEQKAQLYRAAFTYVKDEHFALDIVSETVYKAFKNIKKLKSPEYFETWIIRILINCSKDYIKKNNNIRDKETPLIDECTVSTSINNDIETNIDISNVIFNLKEKYKTIILLKYFYNLTINEIAEVLKMPVGTVKTNLNGALKDLKLYYGEDL